MYNNNIVKQDLEEIIKSIKNIEVLKNKTVLITGATGMMASYFMMTLLYLNDKHDYNIHIIPLVRNIDKLNKIIKVNERKDITPLIQDVCNEIKVNGEVDYIAHMASSANPSTIIKNPVGIIEANVLGTFNVLSLAKDKKSKILFTSTREIYGKVDDKIESIKENDMGVLNPMELRSCYPESKRMAENLIVSYAYQHDIKFNIVRIAHSYGPGMIIKNDGRVMSDFIGNVINNENIILKSTGEALRAFCYVSDCVVALFDVLINGNENDVYNISNEKEEISVKDLATLICEISKKPLKVVFDIQRNNNQYVTFKRIKLNNEKLFNLGWKPNVSLGDGIERTITYFSNIK